MTIIMFVAELLWFMPLFLRQGKLDAVSKKYTFFAILTGLLFGAVIAVFGTGFFSNLLMTIASDSKDTWWYKLLYYLLAAGVAEELTKFAIGIIFIKIAKPVRKIDYIFIMGGAALGFAITENLINNILGKGGIINALLPMHIMWQFYMGAHYYEADQAKIAGDKSRRIKELILAFGVPIIMHGLFDFMTDINKYVLEHIPLLEQNGALNSSEKIRVYLGIIVVLGWLVAMLTFVITSEVRTAKLVKQSRQADEAKITENN